MANITDFAVQLVTPVVLVRVLDETGFGAYRLLWLAAATLLAIVPLGMSGTLLYFRPGCLCTTDAGLYGGSRGALCSGVEPVESPIA